MNEKEMRIVAVDTIIKYAEEQGVKLRRLDFPNEEDRESVSRITVDGKVIYKNCLYFQI